MGWKDRIADVAARWEGIAEKVMEAAKILQSTEEPEYESYGTELLNQAIGMRICAESLRYTLSRWEQEG